MLRTKRCEATRASPAAWGAAPSAPDREGETSAAHVAQIEQRGGGLGPQIQELVGVFVKDVPGIGKVAIARGAVEQGFSQLVFQLADCLAYRGLGAEQLLRRPGEAAFPCHGHKYFKLEKVHGSPCPGGFAPTQAKLWHK